MKASMTHYGRAALLLCGTLACSTEPKPARSASDTANPSSARAAQEAAREICGALGYAARAANLVGELHGRLPIFATRRLVPEQKLLVASRGEEGAQGEGEAGWALDRRVDLVLGDGTKRSSINQTPRANVNASGPGSPYADQSEGGPASGKVTGSSGPGTDSVPGK